MIMFVCITKQFRLVTEGSERPKVVRDPCFRDGLFYFVGQIELHFSNTNEKIRAPELATGSQPCHNRVTPILRSKSTD